MGRDITFGVARLADPPQSVSHPTLFGNGHGRSLPWCSCLSRGSPEVARLGAMRHQAGPGGRM
ncbi:MAG: hypothetical protein HYS12_09685 [Planctomycetes bacterium]|nr:hypothetical protein [Planctomycetota bacterium]